MQKQLFKFKNDVYKDNRGGYSRFLNLYCDHCGEHILLYQKDGPGPLKRMYLDRIYAPDELVDLQKLALKDIQRLECKGCKRLIAIPSIYEKENRKVFLLFSYSVIKKVSTGIYPPKVTKLNV